MEFINMPEKVPDNVYHKTFCSPLYGHTIGYNIYLPPGYESGDATYPVVYHLHGWTGNESSEIWPMERVYTGRRTITVFPNSSPVIEDREDWPVEAMLIDEFIPYIDHEFRTDTAREGRSISGFSMGAGMAFMYAIKHPDVFSSVTAYAGTYHHYFHRDARTVGEPAEKAVEILAGMMKENRHLEENNILHIIRQNADKLRGTLAIDMRVGTNDILHCDNEIIHHYLDSLRIPHTYTVFAGVAHDLPGIL